MLLINLFFASSICYVRVNFNKSVVFLKFIGCPSLKFETLVLEEPSMRKLLIYNLLCKATLFFS